MQSTSRLSSGVGYAIKPFDVTVASVSLAFTLFCLIHPDTGQLLIFGAMYLRGYPMALFFFSIALFSLLIPFLDSRRTAAPLRFVRTFYPQAMIGVYFSEAILLSARFNGGRSYDALFAATDQAIFGVQPSRAFSGLFSGYAWFNEIMFGAYFSYFLILVGTPWLAWLLGREKEAERQVFAQATLASLLDLWYVFFRVQGPKYWFADLHAAWYSHFEGGFFVSFFQQLFDRVPLSGAAFPSSHVALTTLSLIFAARIDRRLLVLYIPAWVLITASTVYLYAHYATDGIIGATLAILLGPLLLRAEGSLRATLAAGKSLDATTVTKTEY